MPCWRHLGGQLPPRHNCCSGSGVAQGSWGWQDPWWVRAAVPLFRGPGEGRIGLDERGGGKELPTSHDSEEM